MKSIDIKKIPHINEITAQHGSFAGTPAKPKETLGLVNGWWHAT